MTKTSTALLLLALASLLAGCTTNPNVLQIHKVTAEAIGLASTDELTMGAELNFKATTAKGRVFNCSTVMTPGILLEPPKYSRLTCTK
jgi:starvation-inducible outer membrane lipoprotein